MDYETQLRNMGLSETEARIYMTALQLGQALPAHLAQKSGVKRPMLYKLIPRLKKIGLLSETVIGKRKYLVAEDPGVYLQIKRNELNAFEEAIPDLRSLLDTVKSKPNIVFNEGVKGIQKIYMELLREKKPILEFVSLDRISTEIEFYSKNYFIPQRINREIPIKILISGKTQSELIHLKTSIHELREIKVIGQDRDSFPIPLDCYVCGNMVAFVLYRDDSEPVGIIIRSIEIATTMRSVFNFIWGSI